MGDENKVKLFGMWASTYSKRVELALRAKGVTYEYIEEDLTNKSQPLLNYNPVHKKVPVLVHNGKPIVESNIILEYIDETWKNSPRLFPEDAYERARVRFWVSFIQQQVREISLLATLFSSYYLNSNIVFFFFFSQKRVDNFEVYESCIENYYTVVNVI